METKPLSSFGEMLKTYRKQQGLTQQQLARKLGIHQNTVGAWERGDYLPATRGMILEVARCLHLNDAEKHLLLEASLLAEVFYWSLPFQRNPFFTGRQAVLQQLHTYLFLEQDMTSHRSRALNGLGGIGKTQVAVEYAYRYASDYTAVFWVNAQTQESLLESFMAIARILNPLVDYTQVQEEAVAQVLDWLVVHRDWLLIFDNVEEGALVQRFIPTSRQGSLLLTTRLPTLGALAPCLELQLFTIEESMQLLLSRGEKQSLQPPLATLSLDETVAAQDIVTVMGGLPLALDQAAGYIEEYQCSFSGFLALLQHNELQILQVRPSSATYPYSVERTFTLAFERLQEKNPVAADFLTVCCFFSSGNIPEALLIKGASYLNEDLQAALSDPFRLQAIFKDLLTYALLHRNPQDATLNIHHLVQKVLIAQMLEEVQRTWLERLIHLLDQFFFIEQNRPYTEHWAWYEQILPHVQSVIRLAERLQVASSEFGSLLYKAAIYHFYKAHYEQAEILYLHAISVQVQALGTDHPDLAPMLVGLAKNYYQQGKYQEVVDLYKSALSLVEKSLGTEHLQLALPLQGLASFYKEMSQFTEAEALCQRVLYVYAQTLGSTHPDVATALRNLATLYCHQHYYLQAESFLLQALYIREQAPHDYSSDIGITLSGLAHLYCNQGRYQEAEHSYLRSLSMGEQTLGSEHSDVASTLNDLARLYSLQARYELAEPLYHRALAICEQIFGEDHPSTAFLLNDLASLYCNIGRYQEAEKVAARALAIYEQKLEPGHRALAGPLENLARLACQQERYAEAEALASSALSLREQHPQSDYLDLGGTLHLKANIYRAQGRYKQAESFYLRTLHLYQKSLGPRHIAVALLLDDLAVFSLYQGHWEEAEQRYQEALGVWKHYQDLKHPAYATCLEHYAELLEQRQRRQEANLYHFQAQELRSGRQPVSRSTRPDIPETVIGKEDENREIDLFEIFLQECCVLSPRASCRAADLWNVYQEWLQRQERGVSLSRQAFTFQLKTKECHPARTNTTRIWRGIELKIEGNPLSFTRYVLSTGKDAAEKISKTRK